MNVSSVKNLNGEVFSAIQDASLTNVVQSNSAQWGQGGGGSVSSKYGTITVDGNDIEATNKAIEFNGNGFTSSFDAIVLDEYNPPRSITWDNYSQGTTLTFSVMNQGNSDNLTYSSNTNVTGLITAAQWTPTNVSLSIPNATAIQFSADHNYTLDNIQASATSSIQVKELAWKTDLPTYTYNSDNKLSAINGSALVGNEEYLLSQGFVQNLTSPKGTIVVKNNKVEATNSAVKGDGVDGFVSAYNGLSVYPGNSATLSWANYVPNTILHVSGGQYASTTLTYSADTSVTGQITLPDSGETSIEVPTNSTSIVIGNENWGNMNYNFTVSAADYYEVGELAWKSDVPTFEAGQGITITQPNAGVVRIGNDETVLFDGNLTGNGSTAQLSEPIKNFEKIKVYGHTDDGAQCPWFTEFYPLENTTMDIGVATNNNGWGKWFNFTITTGGLYTNVTGRVLTFGTNTWNDLSAYGMTRVIGINRKAR